MGFVVKWKVKIKVHSLAPQRKFFYQSCKNESTWTICLMLPPCGRSPPLRTTSLLSRLKKSFISCFLHKDLNRLIILFLKKSKAESLYGIPGWLWPCSSPSKLSKCLSFLTAVNQLLNTHFSHQTCSPSSALRSSLLFCFTAPTPSPSPLRLLYLYLGWWSAASHPGHTSLWRPSPDSEPASRAKAHEPRQLSQARPAWEKKQGHRCLLLLFAGATGPAARARGTWG